MSKILVTGAAGFIGFHFANKLISDGHEVIGLDNINDYYDTNLKYSRLEEAGIKRKLIEDSRLVESDKHSNYRFIKTGIEQKQVILDLFRDERPDFVYHLAAQAGVRYSLINPDAYVESNLSGFVNMLECCRHYSVKHFIFASSSSVYGNNREVPFSTSHNVDHPVSLYAATKKANELLAHSYSDLYNIPVTGLRFFTVYGSWGRPDMAYFIFAEKMSAGKPIQVFNHGKMERDFTHISDISESMYRLLEKPPTVDPELKKSGVQNPSKSYAPYQIFNIGNNSPVNLEEFITILENELGLKAEKEYKPIQPGDVERTWADVESLFNYTGYRPQKSLKEGIREFVGWYKNWK